MITLDRIKALCEELGHDPNLVSRIVIEPQSVTVTVVRPNADGRPYVDRESRGFATDTIVHEVAA